MRTFKVALTENELKSVIQYHSFRLGTITNHDTVVTPELTARIHDLTKRLYRKEEPTDNIETENKPEPQPEVKGWSA